MKIIGDSHLKGNAIRTNQYLNTKFAVSSLIKPGATINQLVYSKETVYKDLGKNDMIVISGGANDTVNNYDKGNEVLAKMTQLMQTYNNTNIVTVCIPHRYNLYKDSMTNLAIQKFNNKLKKIAKLFRRQISRKGLE